jgi:hypothetical protein
MNRTILTSAIAGTALFCSCLAVAQKAPENGNWRAASTTARSITGDIAFSREKISINFYSTALAQIRILQPAEVAALFGAEDPTATGNLYRINIPPTRTFLHHSPLCGGEETDWVATYVSGHTLQLAFLSNPKIPNLTADALANATNLCGTFSYVR